VERYGPAKAELVRERGDAVIYRGRLTRGRGRRKGNRSSSARSTRGCWSSR